MKFQYSAALSKYLSRLKEFCDQSSLLLFLKDLKKIAQIRLDCFNKIL